MGANNSQNAKYGNRHTKSSGDGGCPDEALVWVGEDPWGPDDVELEEM